MAKVGMHEAKTTLSQLVARAERGEEVVITRNGRPVVRLEPVRPARSRASVLGAYAGETWMADDFDEVPAELERAFGITGG